MIILSFTIILSGLASLFSDSYNDYENIVPYYEANICLSNSEKELIDHINNYRQVNGLKKVSCSKALTYVAKIHAMDLYNYYDEDSDYCNLHSWSENGPWENCCYTENHKRAKCMWFKPMEITSYEDVGYEIVFYSTYPDDLENMAKAAVEGWKDSPGHNEMILNNHQWEALNWSSMGVAIYKNYAVVWFGEEEDRDGSPKKCY